MKKVIYIATVIGTLLTGCSPFALNIKGYTYQEEDLRSAWARVSSHRYIHDFGEYWASPAEFESKGGGDCEDFAIALVYRLGTASRSVCIRNPQGGFHEIVKFKDRYLEPQRYGMYYQKSDLNILWEMSYNDTMGVATIWGVKTLEPNPERAQDSCIAAFDGQVAGFDI